MHVKISHSCCWFPRCFRFCDLRVKTISIFVTLVFARVETQDGGDAKIEVSPRDIIYTEPAELVDDEQPEVLIKLDLRYGYVSWILLPCSLE